MYRLAVELKRKSDISKENKSRLKSKKEGDSIILYTTIV